MSSLIKDHNTNRIIILKYNEVTNMKIKHCSLMDSRILSPSAIADSNPRTLFLTILFQYPIKTPSNEYAYLTKYVTMDWFSADTIKSNIYSYISSVDDNWRNKKFSIFVQKPKSDGTGYEEVTLNNNVIISDLIQSQRGTIIVRLDPPKSY